VPVSLKVAKKAGRPLRQSFRGLRYNGDDSPKADFVLANATYSGKILVGGKNLSGSSREYQRVCLLFTITDLEAVVSSFG
jgi:3-isopropylmalate dehydratase small subunit